MEESAANRGYDKLHEALPYHDGTFTSWAKEHSSSHPYHARDGVRIWVATDDLSPEDHFLRSHDATQEVADNHGGHGEQGR